MSPVRRVVHVVLNLEAGGLERLVVELANRTDPTRVESHVLALQYAGRHALELRDSSMMHVSPRMSKWSMLYPRSLTRTLRALTPDVVHSHSGAWFKAARAARLAGVPRVMHTDHGRVIPDTLNARVTDALAARQTDVVVSVSDPLAQVLQQSLGVPAPKLRVIRNGVDTDRFAPSNADAVQRKLGINPSAPVIGSVGRFDPVKAYDLLLGAFRRLRESWDDGTPPVLVLAGDGPERGRIEALRDAMPEEIRRDVHLVGWWSRVNELLSAFDVFALASLSEGTSVSLLEAMSAGVCPVVTAVGGNPDVLGDALKHRLVSPGDPVGLADGLLFALKQHARRTGDGMRARDRVQMAFSMNAMVRQYETLYTAPLVA
jgi:glycosyltransferase involved in cell wall biosynthesis